MFLAVVRRRDRHRRAPGGANVDGLQAVAPHPPGQVAHEGARRVANRGGAHRALQHGGEEGAEDSSAMARSCFSHCSASSADLGAGARASNSSARRRAVRRWTGMLRRSISRLGVSMALLSISTHHHGQSRAVMSSTTLPVCPKTGSISPSLTVHLCLHTAPGNRECGPREPRISTNVFDPAYIIACDAGTGLFDGDSYPVWWTSRMYQSFLTVFRKVQDATRNRLHRFAESGDISGFALPYLGQGRCSLALGSAATPDAGGSVRVPDGLLAHGRRRY